MRKPAVGAKRACIVFLVCFDTIKRRFVRYHFAMEDHMNKTVLFIILLITGSKIGAMDPFSRMFCPNPIVLEKLVQQPSCKEERLQESLRRNEDTLRLLKEADAAGLGHPDGPVIMASCQERIDVLSDRLRRAQRKARSKRCCIIL